MAEEQGEKTEQPSPKKIRDARAKGQVARSTEVVTTVSLLSVLTVLWFNWQSMIDAAVRMLDVVAAMTDGDFRVNVATALLFVFEESVYILLPIVGVAIVAAIFANYVQFGSIFAFDSLMPKLSKINPIEGAKRIFSLRQVFEIVKAIIKIILLASIVYFVIKDAIGAYLTSLSCGLECQTSLTTALMTQLLIYSSILFVIVALADLTYQRWEYIKKLKMTKQEVKREYKESEGDPHIKGYRKRIAHEILTSDSGQRARSGTAVVVNPTHLAVVIRYQPEDKTLPSVTAKGMDHNAAYLRTEAEKAGVPIFRNVKLAQALYYSTDVDDFIPSELYDIVAEVLVWVSQNRELLYKGPLAHGVIDMEMEDHKKQMAKAD